MSGKYYWVKTKDDGNIEIGYKRDSGLWELCGIDVNINVNDMIAEVLCEVSEWCPDELPPSNCIKHAVIKSVCDHPWQQWESVMGDGVLCRKCNTVIKQTVL